ncbi:hypothetical protein GC194_04820, partial [bacterium]|nr:hypothetical protein [bacterium]
MFRVFLEETVESYFQTIPARLKAQCLIDLGRIRQDGLTIIYPGNLKLIDDQNFELFCADEVHETCSQNRVAMNGYIESSQNGPSKIYFTSIRCFVGSKPIGPWWAKDATKYKFSELTASKLIKYKKERFVKPHVEYLSISPPINPFSTGHGFLKRTFFKDLKQIEMHFDHRQTHGSFIDVNTSRCYHGVNHVKLDPVALEKNACSLTNLLDELKKEKGRNLILVNFIDETDKFFHAQLHLFMAMTHFLKFRYKDANISIVDVIVRDKFGTYYYEEDYSKFRALTPIEWGVDLRPFSMLLFCPFNKSTNRQNVVQLEPMCYETLYFDLFHKCREEEMPLEDRNIVFLKNRDVIMHEIYASLFSIAPIGIIEVKDLRGKPECLVKDAMKSLAKDAVVVRVNGSFDALENVKKPLFHTWVSGYPFIIIVLADGDEEEVAIQCDFFTQCFSLSIGYDLRYKVEQVYDHLILKDLPGNRTIDNLYSGYDLYIN